MESAGIHWLVVIAAMCVVCCSAVTRYPTLQLSSTEVKQGDTLEIKCSLSNAQSGDIIQIIKPKVSMAHPSGDSTSASLVDHIMCNNTDLDPFLDKLERYSISEGSVATTSSVQITITDIQPKDSGTFLCRGMLSSGDQEYSANTTEQHVNVTGPIRMIEINSPPVRPDHHYTLAEDSDKSTLRTTVNENPLTLVSGTEVEIECRVTVDHKGKWPIVQAFVDNVEVNDLSRSDIDHAHILVYPGMLVDSFTHLYYFWKMTPSVTQDEKNVKCEARLPDTWTETMSTQRTLNITGTWSAPIQKSAAAQRRMDSEITVVFTCLTLLKIYGGYY